MTDDGEKLLKMRFQQIIGNDFRIFSNVSGNYLVNGKKVVIDFMLHPEKHLIELGFEPVWFGVEVKHFGEPGKTGKMSRFVWQCITYDQSEFKIENQILRPPFVLGFSDVEEINIDTDRDYYFQWYGMLFLAGLANVGMFYEIPPTKNKPLGGWRIRISTSTYFYKSSGKYYGQKYNIFKDNVGNCAN